MFNIFTINLLLGDPGTALSQPNSIVITKEMSEKCFAGENPINQIFETNEGDEYKVTGVADPYPEVFPEEILPQRSLNVMSMI